MVEKIDNIGKYSLLIDEYNKYNSIIIKIQYTLEEYLGIGHTPQFFEEKGINSTCNGKVWRCDVVCLKHLVVKRF